MEEENRPALAGLGGGKWLLVVGYLPKRLVRVRVRLGNGTPVDCIEVFLQLYLDKPNWFLCLDRINANDGDRRDIVHAQRSKLGDPAHEPLFLRLERNGRERCGAWFVIMSIFILAPRLSRPHLRDMVTNDAANFAEKSFANNRSVFGKLTCLSRTQICHLTNITRRIISGQPLHR